LDAELRENDAVTCCACCVGDDSGDPLDSDERSDAECIDCMSLSVSKAGQNSMSSSRSNDLPASNFCRKVEIEAVSVSSFMLRTPLNCFWEF
jgi:hypothetical protein